jgi:cytochrome c
MGRLLRSAAAIGLAAVMLATFPGPGAFAADPAAGQKVFKSACAVCHSATAAAYPPIGPTLLGVLGRKAGSLAGFNYSTAMKNADLAWTDAKLAAYLSAPQSVVSGNKMGFAGLKDQTKIDDLIAYLATLK